MGQSNWLVHSLVTLFSFGVMLLLFKKLTLMGLSSVVLNFYVFGINFFVFLCLSLGGGVSARITTTQFIIVLSASFFAILGNYFNILGLSTAPNPGYHLAVAFSRVVVVTIFATIFFGSELCLRKLFGVIVVIIGCAIVVL